MDICQLNEQNRDNISINKMCSVLKRKYSAGIIFNYALEM